VNVSELGEFALIARLARTIGAEPPADLIVGIGDDAAAWRAGDSVLLATTDTLVQGVHFLPNLAPWCDIGWKTLAVNVSDIAAMGGEPLFALVTLALPSDTETESVDELYDGLRECAREYGVTIAGGDIVRASEFSITVALIGKAQIRDGEPLLMRRDGARAGDVIAVTGTLGDSAAGLELLEKGCSLDNPFVRAHLRPHPPVRTAQEAARLGIACGIDVSDGLLQDIGHVCVRSGLGANIHASRIPTSATLRDSHLDSALALACAGGEDYQMLFAAPSGLIDQLTLAAGDCLTIIGELVKGEPTARLLDDSGKEIDLPSAGWDHLRRA